MAQPRILVSQSGGRISITLAKRSMSISSRNGAAILEIANEYGNTVSYEISDSHRFDMLHTSLWQFVKDSQH